MRSIFFLIFSAGASDNWIVGLIPSGGAPIHPNSAGMTAMASAVNDAIAIHGY